MALATLGCIVATAASAEVRRVGSVMVYTAPSRTAQAANIDFANAREMPLPTTRRAPMSQAEALRLGLGRAGGKPGFSPGHRGNGEEHSMRLTAPRALEPEAEAKNGPQPAEFGVANHPYTTSRVNANLNKTVKAFPFAATGKLFFNIGSSTFVCSASLIKAGVVVTAAHCVTEFGAGPSGLYSNWIYIPSYNNGEAPYGQWTTSNAYVLASYTNGTDNCLAGAEGVVCESDIAVLVQNTQINVYAGFFTGYYSFGCDGFGFNNDGQALINQLGYPVALDQGELMQRNDSQGSVDLTMANNTVIGSLMTGGSSGGPWLVNLGMPPKLQGTSFGREGAHNTVVGVTSWGFTGPGGDRVKQMGASSFNTANIVTLVNTACAQVPAACQ
jgi:hypothetical protein